VCQSSWPARWDRPGPFGSPPFLVTAFGLPVYTVAGATLIGTFVPSVAGVAFYELLVATSLGASMAIAPDWLLGLTLGVGGLAGTYAGAMRTSE
jgi:uncharacterized protein